LKSNTFVTLLEGSLSYIKNQEVQMKLN